MHAPLLSAALAAIAVGNIGSAAPATAQIGRPDCALTVSFGSYAMGIDRPALRAVERVLMRDRAVAGVQRHGAGREGELMLCVRLRREDDATRLYRRIVASLPPAPRGPIRVVTRSGLSAHAPPR